MEEALLAPLMHLMIFFFPRLETSSYFTNIEPHAMPFPNYQNPWFP